MCESVEGRIVRSVAPLSLFAILLYLDDSETTNFFICEHFMHLASVCSKNTVMWCSRGL